MGGQDARGSTGRLEKPWSGLAPLATALAAGPAELGPALALRLREMTPAARARAALAVRLAVHRLAAGGRTVAEADRRHLLGVLEQLRRDEDEWPRLLAVAIGDCEAVAVARIGAESPMVRDNLEELEAFFRAGGGGGGDGGGGEAPPAALEGVFRPAAPEERAEHRHFTLLKDQVARTDVHVAAGVGTGRGPDAPTKRPKLGI